ncbi:5' exonuclease Apollo [Trichonephila clavipes]|uniref:5' exonuclease Apollo n=1 Tax=Trichonephila clavipes TaxID=2585209 RepID=A0A8X6WH48_TRICX|nr:5' exonuclease Apollo [Trichonephila clavipes]
MGKRMCGNGHVIPSTPIAVDMWDTKSYPQARIFFLSHFHADHLVGLNSAWKYPIYTSPITAKFLINITKISPALVKELEIGEDHLIPLDNEDEELLTVTLYDANHCPGSVIFLFSGYFGDILYTADFRYKPGMFEGFNIPPIDVLYLDNTYCSPECIFSSKDDAIESVLSQLDLCLVQSERVFLGLDSLGKEELLQRIAKERHCKINVYPARKNIMDILGLSDIVTVDRSNTKIFVVPTNQISGKNFEKWNNEMKTHAILATARFCGFKFKPFSKFRDIHVISYSNHSSYYELKEFVKLIKPRAIVPIVSKDVKGLFGADISDRADMSVFQQFLREPFPSECIIPESVKRTMNESEAQHNALLPVKKRKIARPLNRPWRRPPVVGVRFIVSEDSGTDSDPDAIHMELEEFSNEDIKEYSSSDSKESDESSEKESGDVWEITHLTGHAPPTVYYVREKCKKK